MRTPSTRAPSHPGIEEVRLWMEEVDAEPEHARQVARLALMLFDSLVPLHGLDLSARHLLEAAALVHDVGMTKGDRKHHKRTYRMVVNHQFLMWTREEVEVFALIARYHRKADPSLKHAEYAALAEPVRSAVPMMAAMLRIADGLDRAHLSSIQEIEAEFDSRNVWLTLRSYRDCATEIWGAERKSDLFEHVFNRRLSFEAVDGYRLEARQTDVHRAADVSRPREGVFG